MSAPPPAISAMACASSRKKPEPWTNTMTTAEIVAATDNYEKLMDRCWYAVAAARVVVCAIFYERCE